MYDSCIEREKNSIGTSVSWTGKHIDKYWIYTSRYSPDDTVNGSGWKHYFTLQANFRRTYYREDDISLYWGIHYGFTYAVRNKDILTKEPRIWANGITTDLRTYVVENLHLSIFGIEATNEKNIFNLEFGIGPQGIIKFGYKRKL